MNYSPVSDHPHTRGENLCVRRPVMLTYGPSPHAWGKRSGSKKNSKMKRNNPTRVGKTSRSPGPSYPITDHPHTRGENAPLGRIVEKRYGPSPHAWGKPLCAPAGDAHLRTIPTRVGKTGTVLWD